MPRCPSHAARAVASEAPNLAVRPHQSLRPTRIAAAVQLAVLGGLLAAWQPAALAQSATPAAEQAQRAQERRTYDIPAGPLGEALARFARESGALLAATPEQVQGKTSPGVRGTFSTQAALDALLAGSGLQAALNAQGQFVLQAVASSGTLPTVMVEGSPIHPAQAQLRRSREAFAASRSASVAEGAALSAMSPANKGDALRYSVTGMINQPGNGDRFGGGTKVRTFGDWGAAKSINGLPAFKSAGEEGGGFSNTFIPSIAIDSISVLKGGHAVGYGDGTDGGVVDYRVKSGRNLDGHRALSFDASSVGEVLVQAEAGDHGERWDYYLAGSRLRGDYDDGEPANLDRQTVNDVLGNFGWNFSDKVRGELLVIRDTSRPDIFRNGAVESIESRQELASGLLDVALGEGRSLRVGYLHTDSQTEWAARKRDRSIRNGIAFVDHHLGATLGESVRYDGTLGVEHKQTEYLRDKQWENTFRDLSFKSENTFTFDGNLALNAGARYTRFDNDIVFKDQKQADNLKDDSVLAYELGAAYSVLENTRVRASVATGYNRFFEKYGNFGTDALNAQGAGDEIVESKTVEAGVRQDFPLGYADLAVYEIEQEGVPRRNSGALESMTVDQRGLELEVFANPTPTLSVRAGYTRVLELEATRADGTKVNGNIFWDGQTTSVPEHQYNLRLDYRPFERLGLWAAAFHSSGYEAVAADDSVVERDGFTRIDLGGAWTVNKHLAVRVNVENLTDERHFGSTVKGVSVSDEGKLGRVYWVGLDVVLP